MPGQRVTIIDADKPRGRHVVRRTQTVTVHRVVADESRCHGDVISQPPYQEVQ